jgi:hypothetical protein
MMLKCSLSKRSLWVRSRLVGTGHYMAMSIPWLTDKTSELAAKQGV